LPIGSRTLSRGPAEGDALNEYEDRVELFVPFGLMAASHRRETPLKTSGGMLSEVGRHVIDFAAAGGC
jgi:hypothetical protein